MGCALCVHVVVAVSIVDVCRAVSAQACGAVDRVVLSVCWIANASYIGIVGVK